ncbi:DUF1697 domain-containing protein [uncultured Brevundimonas sp.]|uniref:DUF1697 domain-containing protein n=1 Tax=uncultured Brevundimonas sp. TaxID=213418 RepID=UPI0030EEB4DB|tara:strand:+ start:1344 stop:1877 length:534 start_codon:yes stop_codon:yes gene_type:complete
MNQRVCLLRGVNVGGVKVLMTELKAVADALGLANPRTLLASGNLVVDSAADPAGLEARLEAGIAARFGRPIEVMVRTPDQWTALIAANPFPAQAAVDGSRLLVMIMKAGVADGTVATLQGLATGDERVAAVGGTLYLWCADGIGHSRMAARAVPRLTGTGTGRNWNTVLKLATMVGV